MKRTHALSNTLPITAPLDVSTLPNASGTVYSKEAIERAVAECQDRVRRRKMFGGVGSRLGDKLEDMSEASHVVTDMFVREDGVHATIEILNTERGRELLKMAEVGSLRLVPGGSISDRDDDGKVVNFSLSTVGVEAGDPAVKGRR